MRAFAEADIVRMRDQLFFEGPDMGRKLSRFWVLLLLAAVIAAAGVVGDSTATVIGAMIVAPLMTPILGTTLAVVLADHANLMRSLGLVVSGALAVIGIGWLLGLLVQNPVVAASNGQVAARVSPRLIDLVAALATGAVGAIALVRDDISDTLPGVAIAISLVPPLAVVGLTLESGAIDEAGGALLLFVTNVSAILAMGLAVMGYYRVHRAVASPTGVRRRRAVVAVVVGLVVIAFPLAATSLRIASVRAVEIRVTKAATTWSTDTGWEILGVTTDAQGILIRSTGPLPKPPTDALRRLIAGSGVTAPVRIELFPSESRVLVP